MIAAPAADDIALMVALWQRPGTRDDALRLADLNREAQRLCERPTDPKTKETTNAA